MISTLITASIKLPVVDSKQHVSRKFIILFLNKGFFDIWIKPKVHCF